MELFQWMYLITCACAGIMAIKEIRDYMRENKEDDQTEVDEIADEPKSELYGWYDPMIARRFGSSIYISATDEDVEVTGVSSDKDLFKNRELIGCQYKGPLKGFARQGNIVPGVYDEYDIDMNVIDIAHWFFAIDTFLIDDFYPEDYYIESDNEGIPGIVIEELTSPDTQESIEVTEVEPLVIEDTTETRYAETSNDSYDSGENND